MRVIGKIELKTDLVVKGRRFEGVRPVGSFEDVLEHYWNCGVREFLFQDVVASLYDRAISLQLVEVGVCRSFYPVGVGGGIRTVSDAARLFDLGVERVYVNSGLVANSQLAREIVSIYGSQAVGVAIDYLEAQGKMKAYYNHGRDAHGMEIDQLVDLCVSSRVGEILITNIAHDGHPEKLPCLSIFELFSSVGIPVILGGGIVPERDIAPLKNRFPDISGVAVCSHFLQSFNGEA